MKRDEIEVAIRKPVNRSARVHVAAHLLRQQKMIDGLFSISHATASNTRHVSTPDTLRYVTAISQSDCCFVKVIAVLFSIRLLTTARGHLVNSSHCCVTSSSDRRRLDASDGAACANNLIASRDGGRREIVPRKLMKNAARSRLLSCETVLDSCLGVRSACHEVGRQS